MDHYDNKKRKDSYESSAMITFFALVSFLIVLLVMVSITFLGILINN